MTCAVISDIPCDVLRPCGIKCADVRKFLLRISNCDVELELFESILNALYFTQTSDNYERKKCIILTESCIFTDKTLTLCVLLHGDNNLHFLQLLSKSQGFTEEGEHPYTFFGRIRIIYRTYNKCYCDFCIYRNLNKREGTSMSRVYVFEGFILPLVEYLVGTVPSLRQTAVKKMVTFIDCCVGHMNREGVLWLGDGADPVSSECVLATPHPSLASLNTCAKVENLASRDLTYRGRFLRSIQHEILYQTWDEIEYNTSYLIINIRALLYLFTRQGFIMIVDEYPKKIERYFDLSDDLIFVYRIPHGRGFVIRRFDSDYESEEIA